MTQAAFAALSLHVSSKRYVLNDVPVSYLIVSKLPSKQEPITE